MSDIIPNAPAPCNEARTLSTLGWGLFWKQFLGQAGALLLLAGIVCFFAFNWADMPAFAKFGIIIAGMLLAAAIPITKGLDHFAGSVGLLFCGLLGGPLLAVFGQVYQTGADAWELFRVWALFLIPLALLGRQTGLWVAAWLVSTLWAVLWLMQERHMASPLLYAPFLLGQFIFLLLWESAAAAPLHGLSIPRPLAPVTGPLEGRSFLSNRWFPRLLGVGLLSILTWIMLGLTVKLTAGSYSYSPDPIEFSWAIPYCLLLAAGGWWYARIHPDTLMHATGLFSVASVLLTGGISFFGRVHLPSVVLLLSSLLFVGCGVAVGKAILVLHKKNRMTLAALQTRRAAQEEKAPEMLRARARQLWRAFRLTAGIQERPAQVKETDGLSAMPWYGRLFIGLCAWVASFLLIGFLAVLFSSLGDPMLFLGAGFFFPSGFELARRKSLFPQQLGLALLFAGASCLIAWLTLLLKLESYHAYLPGVAVLIPSCLLIRNEAYRSLGAFLCLCLLPLYLWWLFMTTAPQFFLKEGALGLFQELSLPGMILLGLLYLSFCLGLAHLWRLRHLHPPEGFSVSRRIALRPFAYGAFATLLCWGGQAILGWPENMGFQLLFLTGPASGIGLTYLLMRLGEDLGLTLAARLGAGLTAIGLAVLSWWLPWAGVGLFALTLARQAGNIPLQGLCIVFLAVCLNIEYYNLESSLLFKSITLCGLGLLLLLAAFGISHLLKQAIRAGQLPDPENIAPDTSETPDDPAQPESAAEELAHA